MNELARKLKAEFNIETSCLHIDLSEKGSVPKIMKSIRDLDCRLMIYNAAFRHIKNLTDHTEEELDIYLNVNINFRNSRSWNITSFRIYLVEFRVISIF